MLLRVCQTGKEGSGQNDPANRFRDAARQRFPDSNSSILEAGQFVQACLLIIGLE